MSGRRCSQGAAHAASLWIVERCEAYARSRRFHGVTLADLCRVGTACERRIRDAFSDVYGVPPTERLRWLALREVRRTLLAADPHATTVADAATSWGFWHLGRFAGDYRRYFGEYPSETLRSASTDQAGGHGDGASGDGSDHPESDVARRGVRGTGAARVDPVPPAVTLVA